MSSRFVGAVGGSCVVVRCATRLEPRALALIAHLRRAHARGTAIRDGATLRYGSSLLVLRADSADAADRADRADTDIEALALHEPDFAGDPFTTTRPDVTTTLAAVDAQLDLLARAIAPARPTMFWETMRVARGALGVRRVYLERRRRADVRDSGWMLAPLDGEPGDGDADADAGTGAAEPRGVHELFAARPALAGALAFPEGWLVVFDGDRAHAILDPGGRQVWPPPPPGRRKLARRYESW